MEFHLLKAARAATAIHVLGGPSAIGFSRFQDHMLLEYQIGTIRQSCFCSQMGAEAHVMFTSRAEQ